MKTNLLHQKGELLQYKLLLNIGWQSVKQVTMMFVDSL